MNLRTLMQAGPAKANELFAKLSETSDGAVKTREKLFGELKAELELHTGLEEQHLFPILRRNADTKELVVEAIRDNKALRAKLTELEALPKNNEAFPQGLKELQRSFRQHARDDKRELLPAVQRALSEDQVQSVAEKIEAGVAEAEQAKHDEVEARRAKARQEREEADRQFERQDASEQAREAAAEKAERVEHEAASKRAQAHAEARVQEIAETAGRATAAAQTGVLQLAQNAANGVQRLSTDMRSATGVYSDAMQTMAPDIRTAAFLPGVAVNTLTEIRSSWLDWLGQTTRAGTEISHDLLRQAVGHQQRFVADAVQGWMKHNAGVMQSSLQLAQALTRRSAERAVRSVDPGNR